MQFLCAVSKKVCNFAAAKEVCMCSLERFNIDLKALTEDVMPLEWELDDQYFSALDGAEVQGGALHVSGSIRKAVGFYEFAFPATAVSTRWISPSRPNCSWLSS